MAFGPAMAFTEIEAAPGARWVVWDLTDLVSQWVSGDSPNDGVMLKLLDEQESYDVGGPPCRAHGTQKPSYGLGWW